MVHTKVKLILTEFGWFAVKIIEIIKEKVSSKLLSISSIILNC